MTTMELNIRTTLRNELVDITPQVQQAVAHSGMSNGLCYLFVPHTTAGITLNENWDPAVREDVLSALERLISQVGPYQHAEGNSPAHVKAILTGFCATIPVEDGALALGTWQGVYLAEFDGPRTRRVVVNLIAG